MKRFTHFHPGELELQKLSGGQTAASRLSGMIQSAIPPGAFGFIRQQSMIWIGIDDGQGLPWAFPLLGNPGFINPGLGQLMEIGLNEKFPIHDFWLNNLHAGKAIGCLLIDFSSRRRIRINGVIRELDEKRLQVQVQQAYPNCPKYIRKRQIPAQPDAAAFSLLSQGHLLNPQFEAIFNQADTAFTASMGPNGADISHRGGPRGFIKTLSPNKILVPDYPGNGMFNTLGNFRSHPFGGMMVIDFNQGYFLQTAGDIRILFDQSDQESATGGTNRLWQLTLKHWRLFQLKNKVSWEQLDFSPNNPPLQPQATNNQSILRDGDILPPSTGKA